MLPDSGVCSISPSDLVGYVGNLINRVKDLERRLAAIESGNVEVNQLSDLSQQMGWVGGLTYMGASGWTQTSYGTLIPPPGVSLSSLGFTLSDGNTYPLVVMDANGVLQFGFTDTGTLGGLAVMGKIDFFSGSDIITYSTTPSTVRTFTTFTSTYSDSLVSVAGDGKISFTNTGYYLLQYSISVEYPSAAGSNKRFLHGFGNGSVWYSTMSQSEEVSGQSGQYVFSGCYVYRVASVVTNTAYLQVADNGTASGTRTCEAPQLAVIRLRALE